ncbi:putative protein phosphatase 2C 53 [Iris pallida]|uniref:protein-serine/threonine phosphatase n=1 Tax=Iris pallida TaxID=29817 RepID=A0AAX6HN81_IRIPA|nr:putative protein phosphatase 2C 53 [Iris pallida]
MADAVAEGGGEDLEVRSVPGSDDDDASSVVSVDSVVCDGDGIVLFPPEVVVGSTSLVDDEMKDISVVGGVAVEVGSDLMSEDPKVLSFLDEAIPGSRAPCVAFRDYVPLWGTISICGKRPEMEDAVVVVPWFHEIPIRMLIGDRVVDGVNPSSTGSVPAHFFGVYDGHGGAQVANYCRSRMHLALVDEIESLHNGVVGAGGEDPQKQWERIFTSCFLKVDDEVGGGKVSSGSDIASEPVAPETVGSTAVVALISSSHIIVANCGDSRAVLYRGKQCVPLSVDHKPNRDDEYQRIEAAGGKVIQWNGYRVFGVLAMSRSIGDRYLKPWIIPEPEVRIIPRTREDECLVLASDGLWDVMSNEEVCDAARRRILVWHKKNGLASSSAPRGSDADPAAEAAADHLSRLALRKGSKDNISIIVVDLKAQRKFKSKT